MVRSRKAVRIYREFSNTKLIQVWASYWFTITFWALPRKVFRHCHLLACTTVSKWVSYISSRTNLIFFLRRVLSLMVIAVFIKMIFRDSTPAQAWFFFKWSSLADDCCCVYKDDIPWFNSRTSLIFFTHTPLPWFMYKIYLSGKLDRVVLRSNAISDILWSTKSKFITTSGFIFGKVVSQSAQNTSLGQDLSFLN